MVTSLAITKLIENDQAHRKKIKYKMKQDGWYIIQAHMIPWLDALITTLTP